MTRQRDKSSPSEFLPSSGVQPLADRRRFELDEAQWQALQETLDRPVQDKPRLMRGSGLLD